MSDDKKFLSNTDLVHGGVKRSVNNETAEAVYLTSGYVYESAENAVARFAGETDPAYVYGRYGNPTVSVFEERLALAEGAEYARGFASGMAAISTALMGCLKAGDHVIAGRALFSSCVWLMESYLPRYGIETTMVDATDLDAWRAAIRPNTKVFFLESPSNPMLELCDVAAISEIAKTAGALTIIDNVFATPVLQHPLKLGADIVVYSATKHIDGQGRVLGGAIVGGKQMLDDNFADMIKHTGNGLSAFNAWVLLKGLETMKIRVEHQSRTAAELADRLAAHKNVNFVRYPSRTDHPQHDLFEKQMRMGGSLIAFDVAGGQAGAFAVQNALKTIKISNNLGDSKSLITHPTTTTHRKVAPEMRADLGITEGALRFSVGLEEVDDLWADLDAALNAL